MSENDDDFFNLKIIFVKESQVDSFLLIMNNIGK